MWLSVSYSTGQEEKQERQELTSRRSRSSSTEHGGWRRLFPAATSCSSRDPIRFIIFLDPPGGKYLYFNSRFHAIGTLETNIKTKSKRSFIQSERNRKDLGRARETLERGRTNNRFSKKDLGESIILERERCTNFYREKSMLVFRTKMLQAQQLPHNRWRYDDVSIKRCRFDY